MKRGSRARRLRQLAAMQSQATLVGLTFPGPSWDKLPRRMMAFRRAALRRRMGIGWLFWAPGPADPEARQESLDGWISLGYTDEGSSESWSPFRGPSADYVVVDEVHHWLTHTEGGAIDGPRGRVDWLSARKPGDA